jgi:hypothetical protein
MISITIVKRRTIIHTRVLTNTDNGIKTRYIGLYESNRAKSKSGRQGSYGAIIKRRTQHVEICGQDAEVLLRHREKSTQDIAEFLSIHASTVSLYIKCYNVLGIDALVHDRRRKHGKEPKAQGITKESAESSARKSPGTRGTGASEPCLNGWG